MLEPVRCVVTGHDETGKSVIQSDGQSPWRFSELGIPGLQVTDVWNTARTPETITSTLSGAPIGGFQLEPAGSGTSFKVMDLPPESAFQDLDPAAVFASMGDADFRDTSDAPAHPLMHRTSTIDYAIILSGRVTLVLDRQQTDLRPGDVVVQLGTNHIWVNRGDDYCRVAFVMLPARHTL